MKKAEKANQVSDMKTSARSETMKKAEKVKRVSEEKKVSARKGGEKAVRKGKAKKAETQRAVEVQAGAGGNNDDLVMRNVAAPAYARVKPEIDAMSKQGLRRITTSIPEAVSIGLGAAPNIDAKMDELRRKMPEYDHERAGRLRDYAYAAVYAHYQVELAAEDEARLRRLLGEAVPLRDWLLNAAELHAQGGDFDASVVASIRSGGGHLDTANDLGELSMLFDQSRDKLAGRTPVTSAEIRRAAELSGELLDALGRRRVGTDGASTPSQLEEDRIKAFWLYYGVYEESRRAMSHLRWYEGDADQLVPSLFRGHRRRGSSTRGEPDGDGGEVPSEPDETPAELGADI